MPLRTFSLGLLSRSLFFFDAPTDRNGAPTPPPTLEAQLSQLRDELTTSQGLVTTLTGERDQARSALTGMTTERDNLQSQYTALNNTATQLRADLTAAQGQISTLTGERDQARGSLTTAQSNITRLEGLCNLRGIDPNAALPPENTPPPASSAADFTKRIAEAKSQEDKDKIMEEYSKAVKEGKLRPA